MLADKCRNHKIRKLSFFSGISDLSKDHQWMLTTLVTEYWEIGYHSDKISHLRWIINYQGEKYMLVVERSNSLFNSSEQM